MAGEAFEDLGEGKGTLTKEKKEDLKMKGTGVFANKKEIKKAFELARKAANTPAFGLTSEQVLSGHDFASMAWRSAQEYCHALALKKGLPEIRGFYGMKADGEFVET